MCDLDLINFKTEKLLLKTLSKTTENIVKDLGEGTEPTVLFTGNGYHVYRPIRLSVLENESVFIPFQNPSTEFIRYAAKRWTVGKNDPSNHPSVNSCMLRVPGSVNSESNKMVEVVQLWSGSRPAANSMLYDFYIKLAAQRFAIKSKKKHNWYKDTKYAGKNYKRIGYPNWTCHKIPNNIRQIESIQAFVY
jgi:hypothetical protein